MAISIIHQPSKYSLSGNPLFLTVQSTNSNILYFKTDVKSTKDNSVISSLKIYTTPDEPTTGNIDLGNVLKNYTQTPLNIQTDFISSFDSGTLDYYIQLTEMNVSNDGSLVSGATTSINGLTLYNASLSDSEFQYFGYRNYYVNPITTAKFLSSKPSINKINSWSKEFLYFLADSASSVSKAIIKVYTASTSTVYEQSFSVGNSKLHRLNVSPKNLKTSLGIDFDTVKKFEVYLIDSSGKILTEIKTFTCINLPCGNEPVNVVWLDSKGGVSSYTFINPKETKTIQRSTYQSNRYQNNSISNNGIINISQKTFGVSQTSDYTLNTPILNDWEYVYLTDMLSSEQVFVELTTGELYPIILKTTSAEVKRKKYSTTAPRFQFSYEAESNLNIVPDSYLSFGAGLSQIGFNVPTLLSIPNGYFETIIGDGTSLYYVVNHNMQTVNIAIDLVLVSNGQTVFGDVVRVNSNTISIEFGEPITVDSVKVMISKLD